MPGKRISDLTAIAGSSTANDDNLVIFDTSEGTTKRILRSQLAAGIVGDLPYTPSGGIAATTVPTAIAELDSEAAKKGVAQTFTAQQTLSSGLVIQTASAANIAAIGNAINTANKVAGKIVFDTTNNRIMVASGTTAAAAWYVADGSASVVPA